MSKNDDNPYAPDAPESENETKLDTKKKGDPTEARAAKSVLDEMAYLDEMDEPLSEEISEWLEGFGLKYDVKKVIGYVLSVAKGKGHAKPDLCLQLNIPAKAEEPWVAGEKAWLFQIDWVENKLRAWVREPEIGSTKYRVTLMPMK
jgi:hypothetical protein